MSYKNNFSTITANKYNNLSCYYPWPKTYTGIPFFNYINRRLTHCHGGVPIFDAINIIMYVNCCCCMFSPNSFEDIGQNTLRLSQKIQFESKIL